MEEMRELEDAVRARTEKMLVTGGHWAGRKNGPALVQGQALNPCPSQLANRQAWESVSRRASFPSPVANRISLAFVLLYLRTCF